MTELLIRASYDVRRKLAQVFGSGLRVNMTHDLTMSSYDSLFFVVMTTRIKALKSSRPKDHVSFDGLDYPCFVSEKSTY